MDYRNIEFYIKKFSYKNEQELDLTQIPMMTRRRLSLIEKLAINTLHDCYENNEIHIILSSKYGELERSIKLIEQYQTENAVSPTDFGFSVHNSAVSIFSILNKIKTAYNSVSAGENSLHFAFLEGVLSLDKKDVLVCFAETCEKNIGLSILISKDKSDNAQKIILTKGATSTCEFNEFLGFLNEEKDNLECGLYSLKRVKE